MDGESFYNLFCQAYSCLPEDFNEAVLWVCIFPQALLLARWLWRLNRHYFRPDLELIQRIKDCTDEADVRAEFQDFYYYHRPKGLLRGRLKVRMSGQRLFALAHRLFPASA